MSLSSVAGAARTSLFDPSALPSNFQRLTITPPSFGGPAQAVAAAAQSPDQHVPLERRSVLVIVESSDSDEI